MDLPPPPDVAGFSLSSDKPFVISPEDNADLCRASGGEPAADGSAHPIWFFVATQVGMGQTVRGICEACDFDVDDGPMMMTSKVVFQKPLRTGQPYLVSGEIKGLTRKPSRKFGCMDILDYELRLSLPEGTPVLVTNNTWALPRKEFA